MRGITVAFYNTDALIWVLKAVAELIPEATMSIDPTRIALRGMDSSHIGLFSIQMHLKKLASEVVCRDDASFNIGFRTKAFLNFLSRFEKTAVHLEYGVSGNEDTLTIVQPVVDKVGSKRKADERNQCTMKLIDIECDEFLSPEDEEWIEVDIDAHRWKKIVLAAGDISDVITLDCNLDRFKYLSEGDDGRVPWHLFPDEDNIQITTKDGSPMHVCMGLALNKVKQGIGKIDVKSGERMKIRIVPDKYCIFLYYLGESNDPECTLTYYLAGKIHDE